MSFSFFLVGMSFSFLHIFFNSLIIIMFFFSFLLSFFLAQTKHEKQETFHESEAGPNSQLNSREDAFRSIFLVLFQFHSQCLQLGCLRPLIALSLSYCRLRVTSCNATFVKIAVLIFRSRSGLNSNHNIWLNQKRPTSSHSNLRVLQICSLNLQLKQTNTHINK